VADGADASGDAHLTVLAGTRENGGHLDQWVQDLGKSGLIERR